MIFAYIFSHEPVYFAHTVFPTVQRKPFSNGNASPLLKTNCLTNRKHPQSIRSLHFSKQAATSGCRKSPNHTCHLPACSGGFTSQLFGLTPLSQPVVEDPAVPVHHRTVS